MQNEFDNMTLKDFENRGQDLLTRAKQVDDYISYRHRIQHLPYRVISLTGSSAHMRVIDPYSNKEKEMISFVSNDYLGLSHHPEVIKAGIDALEQYGAGAGASPLIGGHNFLHEQLEQEIAHFLKNEYAITYTSGYAANCSTLLAMMGKEDIAIMDMFTHASVFDGCLCTNTKRFLHNDIDSLVHVLNNAKSFKNRFVIIDGVYSQDGDIAFLDQIYTVCKEHDAFLIVDDAHGIGVLGKTGRGIIEDYDLLDKVDIITGTFSKAFGCVGGYAIARKEIITLLRYYSRQNIFSAAATPQTAASAIKAIQLIDQEPQWRNTLADNIEYFKTGLETLGLDYGNTESAIFPVMVRNEHYVKEAARILFDNNQTKYKLIELISKNKVDFKYLIITKENPFILHSAGGRFEIPLQCIKEKYINNKLSEKEHHPLKGLKYKIGTNYGGITNIVKEGKEIGFYKIIIERYGAYNMNGIPEWFCAFYTKNANLNFDLKPSPIYEQIFEQPQTKGEQYLILPIINISIGTFDI